MPVNAIDWYNRNSASVQLRYDALPSAQVHRAWSDQLTRLRPGRAIDIGAGTGRDARWLAEQGWQVVAVEPSALRDHGMRVTRGLPVQWIDDTLPNLKQLQALGLQYELVLLSAVWQHMPPKERPVALQVLSMLLAVHGRMVISLRLGNDPNENRERGFYPVNGEELVALAEGYGLSQLDVVTVDDSQRPDLSWEYHVLEKTVTPKPSQVARRA